MGKARPVLEYVTSQHPAPSDERLAASAAEGNMRGLEELYRRYHTPVVCYLQRMAGDDDVAEDLFQEAFFRAYANLNRFDPKRPFRPWLYRIATNVCLDWIRQRSRTLPATEAEDKQASLVEVAAGREIAREVEQAVTELSEGHRTVFIMRQYQGLSYAEIADVCGSPEGTVRSRMHYALKILRAKLRFLVEEEEL